MKVNMKKKGFTIVELVIVIAVIAVLAAVLIPTFISLTNKANKAADDSLVTSLNKALAIEEVDHEINTMHDAIESLDREGYNADVLVTKSNQKLLYSLDENRFLLEEDKNEGKYQGKPDYKFWTIQDSYDSTKQQYSIYAADNFSTATITGLKVGFDAGDSNVVSTITYVGNGSNEQNVVIRTNDANSKLTVDAPIDEVSHYSVVSSVDILAVKGSSYHEYGKVLGNITITKGNLSMEQKSSAAAIVVDLSAVSSDPTAKVSVNTNSVNDVSIIVNKTEADSLSNVELNVGSNEYVNTGVSGIAAIKNTGYETLQGAIDAAQSGDTIVLLGDFTSAASTSIFVNKKVTINLNGHAITGNADPYIVIGSDQAKWDADASHYTRTGDLKICGDGSISNTGSQWDLFDVFTDSKLEIYGGNYSCSRTTICAYGGTFNCYGGNFEATALKNNYIVNLDNVASANIYGGNFVTPENGCFGIYLCNASEVNLGAINQPGPTFNTWRPCISTNGSVSHAVSINVYSGKYIANRNDGEFAEENVVQLANKYSDAQTINIYGGYFEQTHNSSISSVFNLRYQGTINMNVSGGTFKNANASRLFTGCGSTGAGWPTDSNIRVNVTNNAISTRQTVEMYDVTDSSNPAVRTQERDFVVVQ